MLLLFVGWLLDFSQWGHISDGERRNRFISVSLLLPFVGKYIVAPVGESNDTDFNYSLDHPCTINLKTSTSFKVQVDDYMTGIDWIGIGKC